MKIHPWVKEIECPFSPCLGFRCSRARGKRTTNAACRCCAGRFSFRKQTGKSVCVCNQVRRGCSDDTEPKPSSSVNGKVVDEAVFDIIFLVRLIYRTTLLAHVPTVARRAVFRCRKRDPFWPALGSLEESLAEKRRGEGCTRKSELVPGAEGE